MLLAGFHALQLCSAQVLTLSHPLSTISCLGTGAALGCNDTLNREPAQALTVAKRSDLPYRYSSNRRTSFSEP